MKKNVASQNIAAQLNSRTDGSPLTSAVSVLVTGDNGTQTAGGGTLTHKGNGAWNYAPTQAETNFDHIAFTFTHTSGVDVTLNVYTTFPQTGDSFTKVNTALPSAAPGANGGLPTVNGSNFIAGMQGTLNTLDQLDASQDTEHDATQALIDNLPTNLELATALATADDATLSAISDLVTNYLAVIKGKTDQLTFTIANVLDVNIRRVNSTQVIGTGVDGNNWRPA